MKNLVIGFRSLVRNPGYAELAISTLAVGIGCSAAVFSLLDAIYFRPIPIQAPDDLVRIHFESPKSGFGTLSYPEYEKLRDSLSSLENIVAIGQRGVTVRQGDESLPMVIHYVSGNYFSALGIPLFLGRGLVPADDTPQAAAPPVVINYHFRWVLKV